MTRPAPRILLLVLTPLLGGVVLGVILQAADPRVRLYLAASPGLVSLLAGLLGGEPPAPLPWRLRRPARRPFGRWPRRPSGTGSAFSCG